MQKLEDLFRKYYLEYTSYVIKDRAIPYVEDGFKPVQRRIIQTLIDIDNGKRHKSAFVVGQTMKYHPHGDASIYEALVNLVNAGYFVDGGGNFGNALTGTEAAAVRYTECRLLPFAREVLYSPEIMTYVPTYDSRYKEPVVFPAKLPVVLLQGVLGIAPGMICKIYPHNPVEVISAMKKAIDGEGVEIYPDLPTGGLIDVSQYDDGKGSLTIRARVEADEQRRRLVVRELPYMVTTEALIESIGQAARKGDLHVASISDFTTDKANIEIEIRKGDFTLQEELERLYAFTEAQKVVRDLTPMIIVDKHPVIMGVSEIIRFHASYLQDLLAKELEVEKSHLVDKLQSRTLERIFIEERIYKRIETLKSEEEISSAVRSGLMRFKDEFVKPLDDSDIERLLKLPIRRISLFDIEKNRRDVEQIERDMAENERKRSDIKVYAKATLDRLERLLPKDMDVSRKSEMTSFAIQKPSDVSKKDLLLRYDRDSGYAGYTLKSGDGLFFVSASDKILIMLKDGSYHVEQASERLFVGKNVALMMLADRKELEKTAFTIIFKNKQTRLMMIKRCCITRFVANKVYSLLPAGEADVKLVCADAEGVIEMEFKSGRTPLRQAFLSDFAVKGASTAGVRLAAREVKSIRYKKAKASDKPEKAVEKEESLLF